MGERVNAGDEFADDLLGFDGAEDTAVQAVTTVVAADEQLGAAERDVDIVSGSRNGTVFAVRQCGIRLEAVRMFFVIDGDDVVFDDDVVARQADDAFDQLLGILRIAIATEPALCQDNDIAALRYVLVAGDPGPRAG